MVGYGIFAFAALQVSEPIMHGAHLPEWVLTAVLVALAVGFPVAVILAWVFDLTAQGVRRTPSVRAPGAVSFSRSRLAMLLFGVALVAAIPGAAFYLWRQPGEGGQETAGPGATPSIAVLPFADLSPRHDQEYLADGMAEEILNALAQVEGLRVAGRTSAFAFKGRNEDLVAIARKLRVSSVLEGSVRLAGTRLRITAQLINASDGFHVWSQTYDRELTGIFAVQDEIARAVVGSLEVKLLGDRRGPAPRLAMDPEAYRLYLLGRQLVAQSQGRVVGLVARPGGRRAGLRHGQQGAHGHGRGGRRARRRHAGAVGGARVLPPHVHLGRCRGAGGPPARPRPGPG
jgi:TolB-like protein